MPGFWEQDALAEAPAPSVPAPMPAGGRGFWEQDAVADAPAPADASARATAALQPFFEKGISARNSAGQWTPEARARLIKEGLNPLEIDQKAEKSLFDGYQSRNASTNTAAFAHNVSVVDAVPVIGPVVTAGMDRAAALVRSGVRGISYSDALKQVQDERETATKDHPIASAVGSVTGGVAGTAPLVAVAPAAFGAGAGGIVTRSLASAASGLALGAGDAAVRSGGDTWETAKGAALGGGLGGAAPAAGALVGRGVNAAIGAIGARRVPVPGAGQAAAGRLTDDLRNSGGAEAVRARLTELGPEAMLLDASPSFEGRAQGLAIRPETRETVTAPIVERARGANQRLNADLEANLGPTRDPAAFHSALDEAYDQTVPPLYQRALAEPVIVDTSNVLATIDRLEGAEKGGARTALQRAWNLLHNEQDVAGVGRVAVPDRRPEALHNAKEALDAQIAAVRAQQGSAARSELRALTTVRSELNNALEAQVPGYADANRTAQGFFQQREAFDRGQTLLNQGREAARPAQLAEETAALTPEAREAQRAGLRAEVDRLVGTKINDRVALQNAIQGEGDYNRARLATVFGDEPTSALVGAVERERAFDMANQNIVRNSQTAQRTAAAADMDVRDITARPNGGDNGLALGTVLGGRTGAAAALGVRGLRLGANAAGRAADLARNRETAAILTMRAGPERDALIAALEERLAAAQRGEIPANATDRFVRQVLQSQNDRSDRRALTSAR